MFSICLSTSLFQLDDDGGGRIAEPSEEEYDALNDETFGSAINGDWEEVHENLVRMGGETDTEGDALDSAGHVASGGYGASMATLKNSRLQRRSDSDLELNLSGMKLDDVDISSYGESENMGNFLGDSMKMDSSVWSQQPSREHHHNITSEMANMNNMAGNRMPPNPADFLREHFHSPFHKQPSSQHQQQQQQQQQHAQFQMMAQQAQHRQTPINTNHPSVMSLGLPPHLSQMQQQQSGPPKICTLEDIERNLIMQQAVSKPDQHQQKLPAQQQERNQQSMDAVAQQQRLLNEALKHTPKTPTPTQQQQQLNQKIIQQQQKGK